MKTPDHITVARHTTWITFVVVGYTARKKTQTWWVITKDLKNRLGKVKWHNGWRKYAFFPDKQTLYEPICLREIAQFIEDMMTERREK